MDQKPPIPESTVTFGGFEAKGDKVVMKFYFLRDYRPVGEMTYEIPAGAKSRTQRIINAHKNIERSLQELIHVNAAMLASIRRAAEAMAEELEDESTSD